MKSLELALKKPARDTLFLFAGVILLICGSANAENSIDVSAAVTQARVATPGDRTDETPFIDDTRLVTFKWTDKRSFAIRALENTFTNIELPDGETVQGFYLSDPNWEWHVTGDSRRIIIKPTGHGQVNTGTLVSNKRSYELTMISVPMGAKWYQRVRWQIPGQGDDGLYWRGQATKEGSSKQGTDGSSLATVSPSKLNFNYKVKGHAKFRPEAVFDDGVRTWIRMGKVQDMPAIFAKNDDGLEVVDYNVEGDYVVVAMISPEFVLKLRKDEVVIKGKRR